MTYHDSYVPTRPDTNKRQLTVELYQEKKLPIKTICEMMNISKEGGFVINNAAIIDNRDSDRRAAMSFFCKYQLGIKSGQRVSDRRESKKRSGAAYVDRYSWRVVLCVIGIMILSAMDAFFTLNILAKGGEELNIFMAALIEDNITKFVSIKLALTALALLLLTIHHNVILIARFRVRHLQYMVLMGYAILIGYELHLLELAAMA